MKHKPMLWICIAAYLSTTGWILAADEWRPARAMKAAEGRDIVRVKTAPALNGAIELEYAMPGLKVQSPKFKVQGEGAEDVRLVLGNAPESGNPGEPILPVVPCYIALPEGQELDNVEVMGGKKIQLAGTHKVRHGQKAVPLVKDAKAEYTPPNPEIYNSDKPWPRQKFKTVTVQKKRGVSVAIVNLNPVIYRPKSGQVSYYSSMKLKVNTRLRPSQGLGTTPGQAKKLEVKYRPDRNGSLAKQVDNPEALRTYSAK